MVYFGLSKMPYLISRKNPMLTTYTSHDSTHAEHEIDLSETGFKLAFGLEHYYTREGRYDPNFVELHMSLVEYLIDEDHLMYRKPVIQDIKIRKCTEEDWKGFNTPSRKHAAYFEVIKSRGNMYCISPAD